MFLIKSMQNIHMLTVVYLIDSKRTIEMATGLLFYNDTPSRLLVLAFHIPWLFGRTRGLTVKFGTRLPALRSILWTCAENSPICTFSKHLTGLVNILVVPLVFFFLLLFLFKKTCLRLTCSSRACDIWKKICDPHGHLYAFYHTDFRQMSLYPR